jgi:hypothetical protein
MMSPEAKLNSIILSCARKVPFIRCLYKVVKCVVEAVFPNSYKFSITVGDALKNFCNIFSPQRIDLLAV